MTNSDKQHVGVALPNWHGAKLPGAIDIIGSYCFLEPVNINIHGKALYNCLCVQNDDTSWTYLPYGPFHHFNDFEAWLKLLTTTKDCLIYAITDSINKKILGIIAYARINPDQGIIEIAHVHFSPLLKKTRIATEAIYLLLHQAIDHLGYRRCEWKCDSLNQLSRQAAERIGFTFEGIFRQAAVHKGRNRDTAWFSIIDSEWAPIKNALQNWLNSRNFDENGLQKKSLSYFRHL